MATQDGIVLPVLLLSLIISAVFRDEIDSGILFLYKDLNRTRLFNAKIISLVVMYASYVLLTVLTSAIAYFGFLNASGKVVSDDWSNVQSTFLSILQQFQSMLSVFYWFLRFLSKPNPYRQF